MNTAIEMQNVHKSFGDRPVIVEFNLTVRKGEVLGILGPSGVGKSTILRLIAGLETPESGSIYVASPCIGYVFQEARLLPWNTALSNVALPLQAQGMNKQKALERAHQFLDNMELSQFENTYPHQLSGGMRQRVALARAFAVSPEILLLDEPFIGLDSTLKETMRQLLDSALQTSESTVIHVTHEPSELLDRTERILRLDRPVLGGCTAEYRAHNQSSRPRPRPEVTCIREIGTFDGNR